MVDHIDDVAAVDTLVQALLYGRFIAENEAAMRRALLDLMASLRAATAHWVSEFRRARDEGQAAAQAFAGAAKELHDLRTSRPRDAWKESDGLALWWKFPVREPPYAGMPLDDDFPGDATHWTPLPVVEEPVGASERAACPACALGECRDHDASPCDVFAHVRDPSAIRTRDCGGDGHPLCRKCAAFEEP